jgi:hypothetical protein
MLYTAIYHILRIVSCYAPTILRCVATAFAFFRHILTSIMIVLPIQPECLNSINRHIWMKVPDSICSSIPNLYFLWYSRYIKMTLQVPTLLKYYFDWHSPRRNKESGAMTQPNVHTFTSIRVMRTKLYSD